MSTGDSIPDAMALALRKTGGKLLTHEIDPGMWGQVLYCHIPNGRESGDILPFSAFPLSRPLRESVRGMRGRPASRPCLYRSAHRPCGPRRPHARVLRTD
jgi:hypothetical protein